LRQLAFPLVDKSESQTSLEQCVVGSCGIDVFGLPLCRRLGGDPTDLDDDGQGAESIVGDARDDRLGERALSDGLGDLAELRGRRWELQFGQRADAVRLLHVDRDARRRSL